jgi:hypothetical protein
MGVVVANAPHSSRLRIAMRVAVIAGVNVRADTSGPCTRRARQQLRPAGQPEARREYASFSLGGNARQVPRPLR